MVRFQQHLNAIVDIYIGQTKRNIRIRCKEHVRNSQHQIPISGLFEHLKNTHAITDAFALHKSVSHINRIVYDCPCICI